MVEAGAASAGREVDRREWRIGRDIFVAETPALARERARQERQQEKLRRRDEAKARRANSAHAAGGEDPDIAGIVPGPQPRPWEDDDLQEGSEDEVENAAH